MTAAIALSKYGLVFNSKSHFWGLASLTKNVLLDEVIQLFKSVIDMDVSIDFDSHDFAGLGVGLDLDFGTQGISKVP
jgi:hypothetical protein